VEGEAIISDAAHNSGGKKHQVSFTIIGFAMSLHHRYFPPVQVSCLSQVQSWPGGRGSW